MKSLFVILALVLACSSSASTTTFNLASNGPPDPTKEAILRVPYVKHARPLILTLDDNAKDKGGNRWPTEWSQGNSTKGYNIRLLPGTHTLIANATFVTTNAITPYTILRQKDNRTIVFDAAAGKTYELLAHLVKVTSAPFGSGKWTGEWELKIVEVDTGKTFLSIP
jgi:hypothetical protein